ncbi:hypothetical protein SDC9_114995 [bioreactor metagenome]|uniref:Uncharacterized protein n=1 Tax=bioreactor metagenome TaxID=1076179 RepID=A0A645BRL7_9ZZZZ
MMFFHGIGHIIHVTQHFLVFLNVGRHFILYHPVFSRCFQTEITRNAGFEHPFDTVVVQIFITCNFFYPFEALDIAFEHAFQITINHHIFQTN